MEGQRNDILAYFNHFVQETPSSHSKYYLCRSIKFSMKTDKNSVIGFVLLGALFILYFWYTGQQQSSILKLKQQQEDSLTKVAAEKLNCKTLLQPNSTP